MVLLNKDLVKHTVKAVPREKYWPLFVRTINTTILLWSLVFCVWKLPLVEVALFMNTVPLFNALLGFLILGNTISRFEIGNLLVAFGGMAILILGASEASGEEGAQEGSQTSMIYYVVMIITCFQLSGSYILQRKLKDLN